MELTNAMEGSTSSSDRLVPQIGPNHQVSMPPLKQSARIASLEYINRDRWYACGLEVPIMRITAPSPLLRKCRSSADEDNSLSLVSTSNSQPDPLQHTLQQQKFPNSEAGSKDASSCASSTKETCLDWKLGKLSPMVLADTFQASKSQRKPDSMVEGVPGVSSQSQLKSTVTSAVQGSSIMKRKKKRRSCWQTLKRKGNKKARIERGRKEKRWSGSIHSEVAEASAQGTARGLDRCKIVPGCQPDSWGEDEVAAFTLALYLFDKDFCAIKRFLEVKKMKDIVHHYYGKFYGTPAFCRWAGSKNNRNRKCVHGPRILQGWRQDELLRRLRPHVPDSFKDEITEAVKAFNERELTVEGLMSELKAAVGLEVLVRCVGIGVPKRDLTAVHADPAKHGTHPSNARGDMPAGKACSSLSKEEMLEYLTGDFRISKTRAQDLFWEAVWPRLLARGWNSTECEISGLPGSKSPLVFLRPGVKKIFKGFSERGVHFFDSVSEVLKAVANDPVLLDAPELLGDTYEGSENQEDEDVQEWSDDMFETLDMHRLRGRRSGKTIANVKKEGVQFKASSPSDEQAAQDSSESSSVEIDLNSPLSAVSSKATELLKEVVEDVELPLSAFGHAIESNQPRLPFEEIDLNLPPFDFDSSVLTTKEDGEFKIHLCSPGLKISSSIPAPEENDLFDNKTWNPSPVRLRTFIATSIDGGPTGTIGTINLNDPHPTTDMMTMEGIESESRQLASLEQEESPAESAGVSISVCPVGLELILSYKIPGQCGLPRPQSLHEVACCTCRFSSSCKCQKRTQLSLSYQKSETATEGGSYCGKEFLSVPKKGAIKLGIPLSLGNLGSNAAKMCLLTKLRFHPFQSGCNWRPDWNIGVSPLLVPIRNKLVQNRDLLLSKSRVVKVDVEVECVNDVEHQDSERHVPRSLLNLAPVQGLNGDVKKMRCHFSEQEGPVSSPYSQSIIQQLPCNFTIAVGSRSGKNQLLKAKEGCSSWSCLHVGGSNLSVCESLSPCSTNGGFPATDLSAHERVLEESEQAGVDSVTLLDNVLQCIKIEDYEPQMKSGSPGRPPWETTSGTESIEGDITKEKDQTKPPLRYCKETCLTLTSPGNKDDSGDLQLRMAQTWGIRCSGRSHSLSLPVKDVPSDFLDCANDFQAVEITKKVKMSTLYSLGGHEMAEQGLLMTLCSMQDQKLDANDATPKLKGKRSSRLRRRNFSFKQFIFERHIEDVEEGLCIQPCPSQGPWQPTCHLPSTDKISRSPKLRRRRSGLPCRSSCITAGHGPIVPVLKGGTISKGQTVSRLPGQAVTGEEEATASLNWPVHDARFSLRRAFSGSSFKSYRQNGRKFPARWNFFSVC